MKLNEKLKKLTKEEIWQEYCGFLDLSLTDYMYIQRRLMDEQILLWSKSELGKKLLKGKTLANIDEFRQSFPLTSYDDYAELLLIKDPSILPAQPMVWIQTTWEGGLRPVKVAPYTRAMLDCYKANTVAIMMLSSSREKGDFSLQAGDSILYGGAPLPYATGLLPSLLSEDIAFNWLPDTNENSSLSFSERIKKGFKMAMKYDIDYFFAIGSVANYITESFASGKGMGRGGAKLNINLRIALRYLKAKYICLRDQRGLRPGDVFKIKGFMCTGTDAKQYRARLSQAWGAQPIEIAAGTESTCLATETWEHDGMVFFPNACFYEFMPKGEMLRNLADPSYVPRTVLMDEVQTGETYELVISVLRGGAFMRYRIGDQYQCVSSGRTGRLPRFTFVDRVPTVIDIAGFTRLTEKSIGEVVALSNLGIGNWIARKEFKENGHPFLHMYIELSSASLPSGATKKQILTDLLAAYFKYFDSDYSDLKKLLDMEPLVIDVLKSGTICAYEGHKGEHLPRINPSSLDMAELIAFQAQAFGEAEGEE